MSYKTLFLLPFLLLIGCTQPESQDKKIEKLSRDFIGVKYMNDPLGEGAGIDKDPVLRIDAFDCVTYVETVMAYAIPGDPNENKIHISYLDNKLDYLHRKHFWELDQAESGTLSDITADIDAPVTQINGTINKKSWLLKKTPPIRTKFEPQDITLSYIPAYDIDKINMSKLPDVSIIGIIAIDPEMSKKIGTDNFNRHVGFVIRNSSGDIVVRHASSAQGKVVEQPWQDFIQYQMALKNRVGIKIWRIK